jgi:hypothetical protein
MAMEGSDDSIFGEVIHSYTRAEALADGMLIDASAMAREAGIKIPVALTCAAWGLCVALSPAAKRAGNDENGRLWDVLWMMSLAIRGARDASEVEFELLCVTERMRPSRVRLKAHCGPGDDAEPVLTIMLPGES